MIPEPNWLDTEAVITFHYENLQRFGGPEGIRDMTLLESALARPINKHAYASEFDLAGLAAAYAFGIARNHPFVDGNKRAAYVAMEVFLLINGFALELDEDDAITTFRALAAGDLSEDQLATWIRNHMVAHQTR
jgi:death on curing protein